MSTRSRLPLLRHNRFLPFWIISRVLFQVLSHDQQDECFRPGVFQAVHCDIGGEATKSPVSNEKDSPSMARETQPVHSI